MTANKNDVEVVADTLPGSTVIPAGSPLARLNYYDGKFLRAADMELEQRYLMSLVALSNQGLGSGVVHGYGTRVSGEFLELDPGLAIDPQGHPLYLPAPVKLKLQDVIDASLRVTVKADGTKAPGGLSAFSDCIDVVAPPETTTTQPGGSLYVIAICRAEALCGVEDVFGARCESACATTTERPLRREGVVVRAIPLQLRTPFPTSALVAGDGFLRSKVARSFYADEVLKHPNLLSREGLLSSLWCAGATYDASCCEVALGVVSVGSERFFDPWIARRERMDAPSRRYWQWRMRQRPWDVFLAQVLQFQCQLADAFAPVSDAGATPGPLDEAIALFERLKRAPDAASLHPRFLVSATRLGELVKELEKAKGQRGFAALGQRVLLSRGFVELPPAGYLPVLPGEPSVNEQVRALMGEGVDLRFCVVRHDYVGHAFDEARDLDRISLYEGLDDPTQKPKVDVLVPDGLIVGQADTGGGLFRADVVGSTDKTGGLKYRGVAREGGLPGGGDRLLLGAAGVSQQAVKKMVDLATPLVKTSQKTVVKELSFTPTLETNSFVRKPLDAVSEARLAATVAMKARAYAKRVPEMATAAPAAANEIAPLGDDRGDGLWLELSSSLPVAAMAQGDRSDVVFRATFATFATRPVSIDVEIRGQLVATSVTPALGGQPRAMDAVLSGVATLSLSYDNPPNEQELLLTVVQRFSAPLRFSFSPHSSELAFAMTPAIDIVLRREAPAGVLDVRYAAGLRTAAGVAVDFLELQLTADSTVSRPGHPNRTLAEHGLTIVQASRLVIDPTFLDVARPLLFPALAPTEGGLVIQGVLDWVMFHRRREKQCAPTVERPVELPPRTYRVLELTADSEEVLKWAMSRVQSAGQGDATALLALVERALREDKVHTFVEFAGGSAQQHFSDADLAADWVTHTPGNQIAGAVWGAAGESLFVETARLDAVENAVIATSQPAANEVRSHVDDVPADVQQLIGTDALMLFVTTRPVTANTIGVVKLLESDQDPAGLVKDFVATLGMGNAARAEEILLAHGGQFLGDVRLQNQTNVDGSLAPVVAQFQSSDLVGPFILWSANASPVPVAELRLDETVIETAVRAKAAPVSPTGGTDVVKSNLQPTFNGNTRDHLLVVFRARPVLFLVAERANNALRVLSHGTSAPSVPVRDASRVTLMVPRTPTAADRKRVDELRGTLGPAVAPAATPVSTARLPAEVTRYLRAQGLDAAAYSDVVLVEK